MVNLNGHIQNSSQYNLIENRGFQYGDALFETIKILNGTILFWEDHYFRLMASMRILRMEIPMEFSMEFLEKEIKNTLAASNLSDSSAKVRLYVFRSQGGLYTPTDNNIQYLIWGESIQNATYQLNKNPYEVDLFRDFYVAPGLLSTLKTNNKILQVVGSVFAKDNALQNCLTLNTDKQVVEALNGNLFVVFGTQIKTPPLADGCLNGVMRKQIINLIGKSEKYELEEVSVSPFKLQKADEIFITNTIVGIQPISKFRKKTFNTQVSEVLIKKLNSLIVS
jgi:branched-chain amino acid aminotransferase